MNLSFLIRAIFGLVFFQGLFNYIGIPSMQHELLLEFLIVILFFTFIHFLLTRQDKSFRAPGWIWFVIYSIAVFTSILINNADLFTSILMYRQILWPYLFFISILNIDLSPQSLRKINKFILILVISQIPAAIYKYAMYGVREDVIIGTFANQAGSMSAIFPLIIIGYLVALYFIYKKNPVLLMLIPGFVFFAWGGGKRAFFIFLPALLLIAYFIYYKTVGQYKINIIKLLLNLMLLFAFIGIIIYVGGRFHPKFNPERIHGGSFDLPFIISQIVDYEIGVSSRVEGATSGRFSTNLNVFEQISNWNLANKLFGDGPDRLYLRVDHRFDYGISYGISGLSFSLISIGIVGTLSLFLLYLSVGRATYSYLKNSQNSFYNAIAFGTILATVVFCFDFLFYSTVFFTGFIIPILFFYFAAILFKQDGNNKI